MKKFWSMKLLQDKTNSRQRFEFVQRKKLNDLNVTNFDEDLELNEIDVSSASLDDLRRFVATMHKKMMGD